MFWGKSDNKKEKQIAEANAFIEEVKNRKAIPIVSTALLLGKDE